MKTKFFTFLLALIVGAGTMHAAATYNGYCGDNLTWVLDTETGTLTISGTGAMYNYDPYNGDYYSPWYDSRQSITSVIIKNGVTSIGNYAFEYCTSLTSVTIPNSVTCIGRRAFKNCSSLTSVTIPNSVTSIGSGAFKNCSSLTSVTIPNSVMSIGDEAFSDCSGLTSITIPNSVTSIEEETFYGCTSLTSVTIPNSVTSIERYAFAYCTGLTSIPIPNSVTSIEKGTFDGCTSLTSVTIPNSVTRIEEDAFYDCRFIETITLGSSLKYIGENAFGECPRLMDIYSYATSVPETELYEEHINTCENCTTSYWYNYDSFGKIEKSTVFLWIPADRKRAYERDSYWSQFDIHIIGSEPVEPVSQAQTVYYLDKEGTVLSSEYALLHMPEAPVIQGFTFIRWDVIGGSLEDGIKLQAIYQSENSHSMPEIYTNPANSAQKLIRNGNIYVLSGDKAYTLTGQEVK